VTAQEALEPGRVRGRPKLNARSLLCYWATAELGLKQTRLAEVFDLTQPAISVAVRRGEELIREHGYSLEE
jgi:putative transposase